MMFADHTGCIYNRGFVARWIWDVDAEHSFVHLLNAYDGDFISTHCPTEEDAPVALKTLVDDYIRTLVETGRNYRLFLDDERDPPDDGLPWRVARTLGEAFGMLTDHGMPIFISFDHDLGPHETGKMFANDICDHFASGGIGVPRGFDYYVHSQNPIGAANIRGMMDQHIRHWRVRRWQTDEDPPLVLESTPRAAARGMRSIARIFKTLTEQEHWEQSSPEMRAIIDAAEALPEGFERDRMRAKAYWQAYREQVDRRDSGEKK